MENRNLADRFKKNNLLKRTVSAFFLISLTFIVIAKGGLLFYASASLILGLVYLEAYKIIKQSNIDKSRCITWNLLGILYSVMPALSLMYLYSIPHIGRYIVTWLLIVVWATDIGGYFFGIAIRGPKIFPSISPKKTWSGFMGGVLFAILANLLLKHNFVQLQFFDTLFTAIISLVSQIGDFAQSAFKRKFQVKDSGNLIPGHGGIMDRVDGLIMASFFLAICFLGII